MDGFKNTTKIQYFKEGGFVTKKEFTSYEKKEDKREEAKDKVKDVKMVKAGVRQHESALHKGEPKTELKLKCGGRMPKSTGTVKKYKTGGTVENQYAAKKTDKDIKDIANAKRQKPVMLCGGGSMSKYATGGSTTQPGATVSQQKFYDQNHAAAKKKEAAADYEAFGSRGDAARKGVEEGKTNPMGDVYNKGGKVAKKC